MKTGNANLYSITAPSIERYLNLKGWSRDYHFANKKLMVFEYLEPYKKIAIPASEKYADFFQVLKEILNTIADFEGRELDTIVKEILTVYFDRLEFRIISDKSKDGKLPLEYASSCISGLKELVLFSACAEQHAQPVCLRATNFAKEFLENFKLAQTEVGSFIINIDIQVMDETKEQISMAEAELPAPFEHRIVERIYTGINQIDDIVKHSQQVSTVAETAFEKGITANMCDALLKMKPETGEAQIDATIRYASSITNSLDNEKRIVLNNHHFWAIDEISKIYRDKEICKDVELYGLVKSLSKKDIADATEKVIRLATKYEDHYRVVSMELSDNDYRIACDAHRDEQEIRVAGELDMSARNWNLTRIKFFEIVD